MGRVAQVSLAAVGLLTPASLRACEWHTCHDRSSCRSVGPVSEALLLCTPARVALQLTALSRICCPITESALARQTAAMSRRSLEWPGALTSECDLRHVYWCWRSAADGHGLPRTLTGDRHLRRVHAMGLRPGPRGHTVEERECGSCQRWRAAAQDTGSTFGAIGRDNIDPARPVGP
jgi:hypothetical protein